MKRTTLTALVLAASTVAALSFSSLAGAATKTLVLTPDGVQLKSSDLPGYRKALVNCVGCHSGEYMLYQPPTAPRAYWDNMVKRMKAVFKAPIQDADMPELVDYLVKTYGNEQPK